MSWSAELWHQFRRDAWRSRWLVLVYVLALTLAVAKVSLVSGALSGPVAGVGPVVLLCMPLLVAMTVHADSALRVDAFWAVLPVRASVIVVSKLLCVVLLLALWAVAVCVAMAAWHVLSIASLADTGIPDMLAALMLLLLGTALVTAGSTSLASVGVVIAAALAVSVAMIFANSGVGLGLTMWQWWGIALSLTGGAVALLAHRYRARTASPFSRGVTLATGVAVVLFSTLTLDSLLPGPQPSAPAVASADLTLRVPLRGQPLCEGSRLTLPLEVTSPSAWRVDLIRPRLDVSLVDGSHVELSSDRWMQSAGIWGPMLPPAGVYGVDGEPPTRVRRTDIMFELPREAGMRICGQIANVALRVLTRIATPLEVLRVPLASSSTVTSSGYRGRIASADVADTTVSIRVRLAMLTGTSARTGIALGELDYALADPLQPRVVRLSAEDSRTTVMLTSDGGGEPNGLGGDQLGDVGQEWDASPLPGLRIMSNRAHLTVYRDDEARPRDLRSWSDRALLLVIAPAWRDPEVRTVRATVPSSSLSTTATAPR